MHDIISIAKLFYDVHEEPSQLGLSDPAVSFYDFHDVPSQFVLSKFIWFYLASMHLDNCWFSSFRERL